MTSGGFHLLDRTGDEIVVGGIGPFGEGKAPLSEDLTGERFRDFAESGYIKTAFNLRYADGVLTTETRVCPLGKAASRRFRLYWMLIRPFSGLTRRVWLRAARRRVLASS
jgi:hypothetical protein